MHFEDIKVSRIKSVKRVNMCFYKFSSNKRSLYLPGNSKLIFLQRISVEKCNHFASFKHFNHLPATRENKYKKRTTLLKTDLSILAFFDKLFDMNFFFKKFTTEVAFFRVLVAKLMIFSRK